MDHSKRPLLGGLRDEIGSFHADLRQLLVLRWQLVRLEVEAALQQIKRLAIVLVLLAVVALSGLPVIIIAAAAALAGSNDRGMIEGDSFIWWLVLFGFGLLAVGTVGGFLAWRRFRHRFTGIEHSLEELREDGDWLRQWLGREDDTEEPL